MGVAVRSDVREVRSQVLGEMLVGGEVPIELAVEVGGPGLPPTIDRGPERPPGEVDEDGHDDPPDEGGENVRRHSLVEGPEVSSQPVEPEHPAGQEVEPGQDRGGDQDPEDVSHFLGIDS